MLNFAPVATRFVLLEMWAKPNSAESYAISEFEASYTEDVLLPLVPPDDVDKPVETGVEPLVPLAPDPADKESPLLALGAGKSFFL